MSVITTETNRPFYMVFSSRALESIADLIEEYYEKVQEAHPKLVLKKFCLSVPDKFKNQQTTRTILVIDERVFELLKKSENDIDEFKIEKLQLKKHFYPNKEHFEVPGFYIPLPKNILLSVCQNHIMERMSTLREYGFWNKTDYTIKFPNIDRSGNKHDGKAFVYFNGFEQSRLEDIVLTRLFINNTKWPETNQEVHCYWRRTQEAFGKKNTEGESEYIEATSNGGEKEASKEEDTWVTKVKGSLKTEKK